MQKQEEYILNHKLTKGAEISPVESNDTIILRLTGKVLKTKLGYNDIGDGDTDNFLLQYEIIKSKYAKHSTIRFESGGKASYCVDETKYNRFGLGVIDYISAGIFTHPMINKNWKIIKEGI
jgi:hypothetical protein